MVQKMGGLWVSDSKMLASRSCKGDSVGIYLSFQWFFCSYLVIRAKLFLFSKPRATAGTSVNHGITTRLKLRQQKSPGLALTGAGDQPLR